MSFHSIKSFSLFFFFFFPLSLVRYKIYLPSIAKRDARSRGWIRRRMYRLNKWPKQTLHRATSVNLNSECQPKYIRKNFESEPLIVDNERTRLKRVTCCTDTIRTAEFSRYSRKENTKESLLPYTEDLYLLSLSPATSEYTTVYLNHTNLIISTNCLIVRSTFEIPWTLRTLDGW